MKDRRINVCMGLLVLVGTLTLIACSKAERSGKKRVLLPWPTSTGHYSLQPIELTTLQDWNSLSGGAAEVIIDPRTDGARMRGNPASVRYIETSDQILVPSDFISVQLVGVYAHAEKLGELDQAMGIFNFISRPRKYGVQVGERGMTDSSSQNNARYMTALDSTLLMPYDESQNASDKQLPLNLNAGVLAHEHFHAIFQAIVGSILDSNGVSLREDCQMAFPREHGVRRGTGVGGENLTPDQLHNMVVLSGFNEGLADLWAWVYTGDEDFISHSLPKLGPIRSLKSHTGDRPISKSWIEAQVGSLNPRQRESLPYMLGTNVAKKIKTMGLSQGLDSVVQESSVERRYIVGKNIVEGLKRLKSFVQSEVSANRRLEPETMIQLFELQDLKQ